MSESRRAVRVRTLKAGRLVFNQGHSTLDCLIRNLSETGAKLSFQQVAAVPETFTMMFADGEQKQCRIRWRRSLDIGVSFEEDETTVDLPGA